MIEWQDGMILYHGSYCAVPEPDLNQCSPYKDFGLGFYVTTSKEQAVRFIPSAIRKAVRFGTIPAETSCGVVTTYRFTLSDRLKRKEYRTADKEWLHCIAAHRKPGAFEEVRNELKALDIIAGKIANDQTNAALTTYLAGLFGELGSDEADNTCIRRLLPDRLENQICLRTPAALALLHYEGEETIWIS